MGVKSATLRLTEVDENGPDHANVTGADDREVSSQRDQVENIRRVLKDIPPESGIHQVVGGLGSADEKERTRLIRELTSLITEPQTAPCTRAAGLTLIGWLARRMPGECAHALGVTEARESERVIRAARAKRQ